MMSPLLVRKKILNSRNVTQWDRARQPIHELDAIMLDFVNLQKS